MFKAVFSNSRRLIRPCRWQAVHFKLYRSSIVEEININNICAPSLCSSYKSTRNYCDSPATFIKSSKQDNTMAENSHTGVKEEEPIPGVDYSRSSSPQQLLQKVQSVLSDRPSLVKREFTPVNGKGHKPGYEIRIMQWNILSQALSTGKDNFVLCPAEALEWSGRRLRLLEEMLLHDPHIICLEEVDHFEFFRSSLALVGYRGMFFPKPDSPALYVEGSNGPDGCAIFYKTEALETLKETNVVLRKQGNKSTNQVSICVTFRSKPKNDSERAREFCVAVTHLKAKLGWSQLRFEQGSYLADYLKSVAKDKPLFICGDFNAEHDEPVYSVFRDCDLGLDSAYKALKDGQEEPPYTTWKVRGEKDGQLNEVCRTIDYIWFSKKHCRVKALLQFPTAEEMGKGRLPSLTYASDHLSLVTDFVIN